ncbi:MAG: glutamine synthetase III [Eubacteriales bacterium]|nr:glutamine synthetase III [Faecalibacterium sp.]MDD7570498.1 glutamine synthetase III [Faecalibacterium sp.]MDY3256206.1 glutamine synthetase III [Eubacteriales bacterium]MDY6151572.1 glutamine synthetase III [Eubacteriales bacterium]CCY04671.1 putative molybdenum cofactor biosynthesis protein C [Faecalibacterium sp. CAG:1138]
MIDALKDFGNMVFNDEEMKARIGADRYSEFRQCIAGDLPLPLELADVIASAMKDWALEKGATHFTHWFQPMTGITAEKHDSFLDVKNGKVIMDFSGKNLIKGEPDASSFPSGGLRATFEARGYTAWDPTSYAFIKDNTLCIPTAFCSYNGQALDKKTPLLKSMKALSVQALRILRLFGKTDVKRVDTTVGAEQEYFLIDKTTGEKREDIVLTGRTLFGAKPPKGQELGDHYFGAIKPRVRAFMAELDAELWKLGVYAKTEHNEVAPAQHELAPVFSTTNIATDQNQIMMEVMKKVATKHGLICLLHEKPFEGVNGSGKHNNWSICTDTGVNLLEPGSNPYDNAQFLLFLCAVIKGVDEYQDLLRISVASASNDHRLGANEAPPAIVSMFLGDELTEVLKAVETGSIYIGHKKVNVNVGVDVLPPLPKDTTDRNRTSPFAFTGNKFEFRMLGSTFSVAGPNIMLNTVVAEELSDFADELEKAADFKAALSALIRRVISEHKRIVFNGNNYSEEWVQEAAARGLLNLKTTPDALALLSSDKNVALFEKHGVFTKEEVESRQEILFESYAKTLSIEALTMLDMVRKVIFPAVIGYVKELSETALAIKSAGIDADVSTETELVKKLSALLSAAGRHSENLTAALLKARSLGEGEIAANCYRDDVIPAMQLLRSDVDLMEELTAKKHWPLPTYTDLLYSVN